MNKELNLALQKPKHGGNLLALKRQLAKVSNVTEQGLAVSPTQTWDWIDLSSAVNRHPWPVPDIPVSLWHELPDLNALNLSAHDYYGCENFVPVAGTQQAIEALPTLLFDVEARKKTKVLIPQVGYQEHGFAWDKWRYQLETYDQPYHLHEKDWQVLVLIQPNNPTTLRLDLDQLLALIDVAQNRGAYIILDEAFIDAVPRSSLLDHYRGKVWPESLIVLRSVGKFFGLPGARVGFCFAHPRLLSGIKSVVGPWPIATPAVWLLSRAFKDELWQQQARQDLRQRRQRFVQEIQPMIDSCLINAKYGSNRWSQSELFCTLFSDQADAVFTQLQGVAIHVRLGQGWLRFALPADVEFEPIKERLETALVNPVKKQSELEDINE